MHGQPSVERIERQWATFAKLQLVGGTDSEPGSGGFLIIGETNTANISIDNNEIMARNNDQVSTLHLNAEGGDIRMVQTGAGGVAIVVSITIMTIAEKVASSTTG